MNPRQLLAQHNLRPNKHLSQNFMVDANALARMADAAALGAEDTVLEVGAGLGHLTRELAARAGRVVAVEVDKQLIPLLRMEMATLRNIELVTGDMLAFAPNDLVGDGTYKVVANVPYHITSALVRHFLEADRLPELIVLTVQREVAERMAARPGDMSLLAVSVQVYGDVEILTRLKAGVFYPKPSVESAIVRITPHAEALLSTEQRGSFFRIVRAGFSQKRKQLKNSLAAGLGVGREQVVLRLNAAGVDPTRRAETLSLGEWQNLHRSFLTDPPDLS